MFHFTTKAESLEQLRPLLRCSTIPVSCSFRVGMWQRDKESVLSMITAKLPLGMLIVRSSAANEDAGANSMAGVFESVPFVPASDHTAMGEAIERVIRSYIHHNGVLAEADMVLVQPMIERISMAGVVFTQDLRSGAPYYVINYDDATGRHDAVTSGSDRTRTLFIHRGYERRLRSSRFARLMDALQEVEDVVGVPGLDVEFIVDEDEVVHIVQVRPLAVRRNWNRSTVRKVDLALDQTRDFIRSRLRPIPGIVGRRSLFGLMPDWNPVEMLGAAPRPLAVSLYRMLITDGVWAEARAGMGYRDLSGRPLLTELNGRPYIDVRESFNSFLPASLEVPATEKLVNAWLDRLEKNPELHDKVEFEIALTTHVPGFRRMYADAVAGAALSDAEFGALEAGLKTLTIAVLSPRKGLLDRELEKTSILHHVPKDLGAEADCLQHAARLLRVCKEHGTRPFSVLARCAFIAEALLRALVVHGAISGERAQTFRGSVRTVLSDFLEDMRRLRLGEIGEALFFDRYGHLRPGTYDILSPRYDQRRDFMEKADDEGARHPEEKPFSLTDAERCAIDALLVADEYPVSADELFTFMSKAIAGREEAKFRFTRALSRALEEIALWGEAIGLNREELSYLRIEDVLAPLSATPLSPWEDILRVRSRENMEAHGICQAIHLPYLICGPDDVDIIPVHKTRPNFVTAAIARGRGLLLSGHEDAADLNFQSAIIFIENADPGFDWIFAHPIAGLVTKYGGANSHMAIRCAELGIPAAIGCGEQLFEYCKHSQDVTLDCGGELLAAQRNARW